MGHVLELLHDAEPRWKTLRAVGREWRHNLLLHEVFARQLAAQPAGGAFQFGYARGAQLPVPDESEWSAARQAIVTTVVTVLLPRGGGCR